MEFLENEQGMWGGVGWVDGQGTTTEISLKEKKAICSLTSLPDKSGVLMLDSCCSDEKLTQEFHHLHHFILDH